MIMSDDMWAKCLIMWAVGDLGDWAGGVKGLNPNGGKVGIL